MPSQAAAYARISMKAFSYDSSKKQVNELMEKIKEFAF
jgi:hypothetical protein